MYDVAIIGGGPIGLFSVFSCGLEGLSCAIFDAHFELGGQCKSLYSTKKIYDIPAHKQITGGELIEKILEQISVFKYDVFLDYFVSSIDEKDDVFVIKNSKKALVSRCIIIALGAGVYKPVKLSVPFDKRLEGEKILYTVDDIEKFKACDIAILGGGDSAVDWALEISRVAKTVYLVHRRDVFKSNAFALNKINYVQNINKKAPFFLKKIEEIDGKLILFGEEEIKVDYILPFYGAVSNHDFLNNWNLLLKQSKILVNPSTFQTSRNGIYAVGDCVTYSGKRNLILTGFSEAMIASRAISKFLYPSKAVNLNYSTNLDIFKCNDDL